MTDVARERAALRKYLEPLVNLAGYDPALTRLIMVAADRYALAVLNRVERLFCDQMLDPDGAQAALDALRARLEGGPRC